MRPLSEIEADLASLGRPRLQNFTDALKLARGGMPDFSEGLALWIQDNPEKNRQWKHLRAEYDAAAEAADARAMAIAEADRLLVRLAGIVGDKALESIPAAMREPHEGMRAALAFEDSPAWSLTLLGGVGTGKTVPAAYLAKRYLERGDSLVWWRASSIAKGSLFGREAEERDKRASTAALLVIDDLGSELATGPWVANLEDVLGYRHAHNAKTVITGNLLLESPDKDVVTIRSLLRERLFDRLSEGIVVGTGKGSMRRKP